MRLEARVANESDALVLASASLHASGIGPGDPGWDAAIAAQQLLAVWLESEDPACVRVVVDEPLSGEEAAQWVGVVRATLQLADGRLAVCGGIAWLLDGGRWTREFARVLELPAGRYRATLYCHAPAPNGRWCAAQVDAGEPLGRWFRRTRAGEPMPCWLHNRCVDDPTLDPGHAARWRGATEQPGGEAIDFVLHLETIPAGAAVAGAHAPEDGLWIPRECRRPQPFPLGLPLAGRTLAFAQPSAAAAARSGQPKWSMPALAQQVASQSPASIPGGPVGVPLTQLARVARIAWWCHPYAHPGLRVVHSKRPPRWRDIEDVEVAVDGLEWRLSLRWHGQPADALQPLLAVGAQLAKLADASLLELYCARPGHSGAAGAQHWRGAVREGTWQIEAAAPSIDAATLAEALALAEAAEGGRRLRARDAAEARRVAERVQSSLADCLGANALVCEGEELVLRRRDPLLFERIAARVFWMRYGGIWPLLDEDAA